MRRTVADLHMGEMGVVSFLSGSEPTVRRMIDLGITQGAVVTVKKIAPFDGPFEIEVRGSRIGIRREQAAAIALCAEREGEGSDGGKGPV